MYRVLGTQSKKNEEPTQRTITGYDPNNLIQVGSTTVLKDETWVVKSIERRDHKGNFIDDNNKKNSFYTAVIEIKPKK